MRGKSSTVDEIVAAIADDAHGVVTRAELLAAGIPTGQVERRVAKGGLIPEYPGVYRAGHAAPSREATYMAATKACGPGAPPCGKAAGHLLRILKSPIPPPPEVLTTKDRKPKGLKTRRTRRIDRRDVTTVNGIPVTTVPRTLVDLAAVLDEDALARACHEAGVIYRVTPRQVEAVLERMPRAKGTAKLRRIMSGDVKVVLSKLEKRFLQRLETEGLPLPETNRVAGGRRVDCRWPDQKLTVELDGFRFHNSRHSWEQGNLREREARKRGDEFRRFTYADVFEDPAYMLAELRELLLER
jgi:very-short-patch-repair endonuclease